MLFSGERIFQIGNLGTVPSAVFLYLEMPNGIEGCLRVVYRKNATDESRRERIENAGLTWHPREIQKKK